MQLAVEGPRGGKVDVGLSATVHLAVRDFAHNLVLDVRLILLYVSQQCTHW